MCFSIFSLHVDDTCEVYLKKPEIIKYLFLKNTRCIISVGQNWYEADTLIALIFLSVATTFSEMCIQIDQSNVRKRLDRKCLTSLMSLFPICSQDGCFGRFASRSYLLRSSITVQLLFWIFKSERGKFERREHSLERGPLLTWHFT